MKKWVSDGIIVPRDLVGMLSRGSLSPHDFGHAIAEALGFQIQDGAAPAKVDFTTMSVPAPETAPPIEPIADDSLYATFRQWMEERLPDKPPIGIESFQELYGIAGGDMELLHDLVDYADWFETEKAPIKTIGGFFRYQLNSTHHGKIRDESESWRQKRDTDATSITKQALQRTEAVLTRTAGVSGPQMDRIKRLQEAVNQRREASGIATAAGG